MTGKNFDNKIRGKLYEYREQPPADMFSRIEKSLGGAGAPVLSAKGGSRGRLNGFFRYAAAAAIVTAGILFSLRYAGLRDPGKSPATAEQIINNVRTDKVDAGELILLEEERIASRTSNLADIIREVISEDLGGNTVLSPSGAGIAATGAEKAVIESNTGTRQETLVPAGNSSSGAPREKRKLDRSREIEDYWATFYRTIAQEESRGRKGKKLAASLYGGNFGTGTGNVTYDNLAVLSANGMLKQDVSLTLPGNGPKMSRSAIIGKDIEANLRHRMPISVGISVGYPLSDRVSLLSGINYSYLYSSGSHTLENAPNSRRKVIREQHYLGIPLGVSYSFYSNRVLNLYVRGGGMIEKAVNVREREIYETPNSGTESSETIRVKGFQPSIDASLGANISIVKGVGLYVEPGVAYYFENTTQKTSYRTDNPTNFTVRVGVRFNL